MAILKETKTLELTPALKDEISRDVQAFRRRLDMILQEEFGDRKNALFLELKMDSKSYTDHKIVHIGALTIPPREDKGEVISNLLFLEGHEAQHVHSTNDKWWQWAHKTGVTELCKIFSANLEGPGRRRFIKPQDVDTFISDMSAKGVRISKKFLEKVIHGVVNSCEDGRIERIRSKKDFIFRKLRKAIRGQEWLYHPVAAFVPSALSPDDKLRIILNQVLSLATTSLYQKDFLLYADDEMEEKTLSLMANIKGAVNASGTEKSVKESLMIVYKLADEILDAMQKAKEGDSPFSSPNVDSSSSEDPSESLDDEGNPKSSYPNTTRSEEKDEGNEEGDDEDDKIFSKSDLDPDDGDDKAEDSASEGDDDGDDESTGSASGDDSKDEDEGDGESESGSSSDGEGESTDGSGDKNSGEDGDESEPDSGESKDKSDKAGNSRAKLPPRKGERITSDEGVDELSDEEIEAVKREILEAMKEAAELANGEIEISEAMDTSTTSPNIDETPNTDKEPDTRSADEAARENGERVTFIENTRAYELGEDMPVNLELEAAHFREQIDELFRNKQKPDIRDRKTGRMDSSRITKLAMHQIDIYKKPRTVDEFDGVAYFLVDDSGSMGSGYHSKRWFADYALAIIEEGFKCHVPLKIVAFDASGSNCVQHEVIKGFSEKTNANCSYNFCVRGRSGWGNKDGYSIRVAASELLARPEKKKILFVLSDGAPTDYIGGYRMAKKDVHDAVKAAREAGIEVCAIYFDFSMSAHDIDEFKDMYEYNYVITEPENVPDEVARLMHKWVM